MKRIISPEYLKNNSSIEANLDDNIIIPAIVKAEQLNLSETLGDVYLTHLLNAVNNNTVTSDENNLIINYIAPLLVEWSLYHAIPFINFKLTNKSVSAEKSTYSDSSELSDIKFLQNYCKNNAEQLANKLQKHLKSNYNLYPIWSDSVNYEQSIKTPFFSGIHIPNKNKCR